MRKGNAYLASLKDGRDVRIGGERVSSVPDHVDFQSVVRTVAGIIDAHHSSTDRPLLFEGQHPACFKLPATAADLTKRGRVTDWLASRTWGCMARLYDYSAALVCGLHENRSELGSAGAVATHFYERFRDELLFGTLAFSELPGQRKLGIVERRKDGIVVSGSKTLATGAAHVDEIFIASTGDTVADSRAHPERILAFFLQPKTAGLTLHCRRGLAAQGTGTPGPLAPYDEIDASLELKDVFIPSERVLVAGDLALFDRVNSIIHSTIRHPSARRLETKYRLLWKLSRDLAEETGARANRRAREAVEEIGRHYATVSRLVRDAEVHGAPSGEFPKGFQPDLVSLNLALHYAITNYPKVLQALQLLGGQRIVLGDGPKAAFLELAAELTGSRFAHRQALFEHYSTGGLDWIESTMAPGLHAL